MNFLWYQVNFGKIIGRNIMASEKAFASFSLMTIADFLQLSLDRG